MISFLASCSSKYDQYISSNSLIKKDGVHYLNNKAFTGFSISRSAVRTTISEFKDGKKNGISKSWDIDGNLRVYLKHNGVKNKLDNESMELFCKQGKITMWTEVKNDLEYTYHWNDDGSFKIREISDLDMNPISKDNVQPSKEKIQKLLDQYVN